MAAAAESPVPESPVPSPGPTPTAASHPALSRAPSATAADASSDGGAFADKPRTDTVQFEHEGQPDLRTLVGGRHRIVHEVPPDWVLLSRWSKRRCQMLHFLNKNGTMYVMLTLVVVYLVLAVVAISLDVGVVCVNGKHRAVERRAIYRLRHSKGEPEVYSDWSSQAFWKRGRHAHEGSHDQLSYAQLRRHRFLAPLAPRQPVPLDEEERVAAEDMDTKRAKPVMLCEPLYGQQARHVFHIVGDTCLAVSALLLLEHLLRMIGTGPRYFFKDVFLRFDFIIVSVSLCCDLLIVLLLRPELERLDAMGTELDDTGGVAKKVILVLILCCRLLRVTMLWRLVRAFNGELDSGVEVARLYEAMDLFMGPNGLKRVEVFRVRLVRNSPAEREAFRTRLAMIQAMMKQHGEVKEKVKEKVLFFGTGDRDPAQIVDSVEGVDPRYSVDGCLKSVVSGSSRPNYCDSCYAYTDWEADPTGRRRELIMMRALVGSPQNGGDPADASQWQGHRKLESGHDCVVFKPMAPLEYQPASLGLENRGVESEVFAFPEPGGRVMPLAIITYENQNPPARKEIRMLREAGVHNWREMYNTTKHAKDYTPAQVFTISKLRHAIDGGVVKEVEEELKNCVAVGISKTDLDIVRLEKKMESEESGVSLAFILQGFTEKAREVSGQTDPTFEELKTPLFLTGDHRVGNQRRCPRDGEVGCAFVDTLKLSPHASRANVFLSWVWKYKLSVVREGLERWAQNANKRPEDIFFYICFFCNNQYRLLQPKSQKFGSDNLENTFRSRLKSIGCVVALLDAWKDAVYLKRIWTIYEQYVAADAEVKVEFVLPKEPAEDLIKQVHQGKKGIEEVRDAIKDVDAEQASATFPEDTAKVKDLIKHSAGGFAHVNERVKRQMVEWIASEFTTFINDLVLRG